MTNEIKGGGTGIELSADINVITAEINAYKQVAGEAIFEIGKRLKHVKENDLAHGEWTKWLSTIGFTQDTARRFVRIYEDLGDSKHVTTRDLGVNALYELTQIPVDQRDVEHTVNGKTKTPDEMTVKELREVKKALKDREQADKEREARIQSLTSEIQAKDSRITQAEARASAERRERERLERENAELSEKADKPPEVRYETKTEYVEVRDETIEQRLASYEERFGAIENYSDRARATNIAEVTTSVMTFTKAVRDLTKRHAYLLNYQRTVAALDGTTKREYNEAVTALSELARDFNEVSSGNTVIIDHK